MRAKNQQATGSNTRDRRARGRRYLLEENLGAINVQLTPADLREIEIAFSKIRVHGDRMSEKYMRDIDHTV